VAPPAETCKLIGSFGQSEIKMIKYVEANSAACGVAPDIANHPRAGHQRTEAMLKTVCAVEGPGERPEPGRSATSITLTPVSFESRGKPRQNRSQMPLLA